MKADDRLTGFSFLLTRKLGRLEVSIISALIAGINDQKWWKTARQVRFTVGYYLVHFSYLIWSLNLALLLHFVNLGTSVVEDFDLILVCCADTIDLYSFLSQILQKITNRRIFPHSILFEAYTGCQLHLKDNLPILLCLI